MTERIPWDQYFMSQSLLLSLRSTCTRLTVGATIVREKRIIAGGYNGSVSGDVHCIDEGCYVVDGHCLRTIHAETQGAEIYVTHFPCLQCTKMIIQAGITKIYYLEDYHNDTYALKLIEQAHVQCQKVALPKDFFQQLDFTTKTQSSLNRSDGTYQSNS